MIRYYKHFTDQKKPFKVDRRMSFKIFDKKLFQKYIKIWKKITDLVGNDICDEDDENDVSYIKSKISIIDGEIRTGFHDKGEPEQKVAYDCFLLIGLNSIIEKNDNTCYPQVYLEESQIE